MNKAAKERKKKTLLNPGIALQTAVVNSKDLGTECWSAKRLALNDCTACDQHDKCTHSVKGVYPNAHPAKLYQSQLALLELKQEIRKLIGKE